MNVAGWGLLPPFNTNTIAHNGRGFVQRNLTLKHQMIEDKFICIKAYVSWLGRTAVNLKFKNKQQ